MPSKRILIFIKLFRVCPFEWNTLFKVNILLVFCCCCCFKRKIVASEIIEKGGKQKRKGKWSIREKKNAHKDTRTHVHPQPRCSAQRANEKIVCRDDFNENDENKWEKTEKEDAKPLLFFLRSFVHPYLLKQANSVALSIFVNLVESETHPLRTSCEMPIYA